MVQKQSQPQKAPHQGRCLCQCLQQIDPQRLFYENTRDVADTLQEIMIICGIHECKARGTRQIILKAFQHYDDVRHSFDQKPKTSMRKKFLLRELTCRCLMTYIEARLAYDLMKRAFKAFYSGQADLSIRNPLIEAAQIHEQEYQWLRAGKRTVEIFNEYAGFFFPVPHNYEERIRNAYKELFERMKERSDPIVLKSCCDEYCVERVVPHGQAKAADEDNLSVQSENYTLGEQKFPKKSKNKDQYVNLFDGLQAKRNFEKLPRCTKCKSLKLMCYCNVDKKTGILKTPYGQGPFKVSWKLEDEISKPRTHECPVDCDDLSEMLPEDVCFEAHSISICECECEEESETVGVDAAAEVVEDVEDQPSTEVSETQTIYSCHMPQPDCTPVMLKDKPRTCVQFVRFRKCTPKKILKKRKPLKKDPKCICVPKPCSTVPSSSRTNTKSKSTTESRLLSGESGTKSSEQKLLTEKSSEVPVENKTTDLNVSKLDAIAEVDETEIETKDEKPEIGEPKTVEPKIVKPAVVKPERPKEFPKKTSVCVTRKLSIVKKCLKKVHQKKAPLKKASKCKPKKPCKEDERLNKMISGSELFECL